MNVCVAAYLLDVNVNIDVKNILSFAATRSLLKILALKYPH